MASRTHGGHVGSDLHHGCGDLVVRWKVASWTAGTGQNGVDCK